MRHDAEDEEHPQAKTVLGRLSVGVDGDHEAGNEPQVPAAQPQPARWCRPRRLRRDVRRDLRCLWIRLSVVMDLSLL